MARYTDRYGLSYFGGAVPGNITEDGNKFTLFDPQLLDRLLGAMEDHDHSGGEQLLDPADAPTAALSEVGGHLPPGRTFFYAITFLDRFGLETVPSDAVDVITPAPVRPPASPALEADSGTVTVDALITANSKTLKLPPVTVNDAVTTSNSKTISSAAANFATADVGRTVTITGAGTGGAALTAKIASVTNGDTAVLDEAVVVGGTHVMSIGRFETTFTADDVGRQVTVVAGGANSISLIATIEAVVDASTVTLDIAAASSGTRSTDIERGALPNEYHQYALSVLVYAEGQVAGEETTFRQETTLSVPVPITPPANGIVTVSLPEMPEGGHLFRVWRKSIRDSAFTKVGTVGPEDTFVDNGSVKADECACTPENMPPATNTTNGTNSATITVADLDQDTLADSNMNAIGWRLYRTETAGVYNSRSLVAEIRRAADGVMPYAYTDVGEDLLAGRPPLLSNTIVPSQPLSYGYGDLPALPDPNLRIYTPWVGPNNQLYMLTNVNQVQAWTPVLSLPIPDSIRDLHVATGAAISMDKLALEPLLARVNQLEIGGGGAGADAGAIHYRGEWAHGPAYAPNDLVRHEGLWWLSPSGQAPAPVGYAQDFSTDGPLADPTLDTLGNYWLAENGAGRLGTPNDPNGSVGGAYPFLYDSGSLSQDFSVALGDDPSAATYLYAGVSDDRLSGYYVVQSGTSAVLYAMVGGVGTQVQAANFQGAVPDPAGATLRLRLRSVNPDAGTHGSYYVSFMVNDWEPFSGNFTPEFTPGTWIGLGTTGDSTAAYASFIVAAPPGSGDFDPANWIQVGGGSGGSGGPPAPNSVTNASVADGALSTAKIANFSTEVSAIAAGGGGGGGTDYSGAISTLDSRLDVVEPQLSGLSGRVSTLEASGGGGGGGTGGGGGATALDTTATHLRGEWSPGGSYVVGDIVSHDGDLHIAHQNQPGASLLDNFDGGDGPVVSHPFLDLHGNPWEIVAGMLRPSARATSEAVTRVLYDGPGITFDTGSRNQDVSFRYVASPTMDGYVQVGLGLTTTLREGYVFLRTPQSGGYLSLYRGAADGGQTGMVNRVPPYVGQMALTTPVPPDCRARATMSYDPAFGAYTLRYYENDVLLWESVDTPSSLTPGTGAGLAVTSNHYDGTANYLNDQVSFDDLSVLLDVPFSTDYWRPLTVNLPMESVLARLAALESSARDGEALHYRGDYVPGLTYESNDLVRQNGQLYLTTVGQTGGNLVDNFDRADGPLAPHPFFDGHGNSWRVVNGRLHLNLPVVNIAGTGALTFDLGTTAQDFTVRQIVVNAGGSGANAVYLLGLTGANQCYRYTLSRSFSSLVMTADVFDGAARQPTTNPGVAYPVMPTGEDAVNHDIVLRFTLEDLGGGQVRGRAYVNGVVALEFTDTATFSVGTRAGWGTDYYGSAASNNGVPQLMWDDFVGVVPSAFNPSAWTIFPPTT